MIAGQRSLAALMGELMRRLPLLLNFSYLSLVLYDEHRMRMRLHVWHGGVWREVRPADEDVMEVRDSFSGWVWQHQRPLVIGDLRTEHEFSRRVTRILVDLGVRALCSLPLTTAHRRLGALNLGSSAPDAYDEGDLELPLVVAKQVAVAVDNALHAEELDAERLRLREVVGNVPGIVWERHGAPTSPSRQIVFVSEHARAMWGYSPDEVAASFWTAIVHPGDRDRALQAQVESFATGQPAAQQYRVVARDGRILWAETFWTAIVDAGGASIGARGVTLDVTALRAAERAQLRQEQLVHDGRIAERARIARELHDGFVHDVVTGWRELDSVMRTVLRDSPAHPEIVRILGRLERAVEGARGAILALNESIADDGELSVALRSIAEQLQDVHAVAFTPRASGVAPLLPPVTRAEIVAIAREALTNAFRHARARHIEIEVAYGREVLRVAVLDDGCGIDPGVLRAGRPDHLGLTTMRERAERLGARLAIEPRSPAGTTVELTVPAGALEVLP